MQDIKMIENKLPKDWKVVELKEVVSILGDGLHGTPKYSSESEYYFINGNNLVNGKIKIKDNTKKVSVDEFEKYKKPLNDSTVLVSINGTLGNQAFYNNEKVILGKSACYFNVLDCLNKKYVSLVLSGQDFLNYAHKNATGSTIPNVSLKSMREFKFPLPPLETQHAIVSKIEELFSELDQGIADLKTAQAQLKVYRQSVLKHAFEGKLTNKNVKEGELPDGWEVLKIRDVSKIINGDRSKNYPSRSHYVKDGVPFISAGTIDDNRINNTEINYITESKFDSLRSGKLEKRDLIYCLRGSLGKCAIYPFRKGAISSSLCIVRASELIEHEYLFYYLLSPLANNEILKYDNGTAQPNLSAKDFSNFEIPYTSKQEQHFIVQEIESRLSVADKMEESIQESLQKAEALRQSILKKAFSGELV